MDQRRFDTVAKFLADRKLTRREALTQAGTGIAAGALATAGLSALTSSPAAAQGATPAAATPQSPTALKPLQTPMLFVQSFQSGTAEAIGTDGTKFKVTLEKGLGQTIYFSDRPERVVGAMPTGDFLDTLGFMPDNPPNAAILVEVDEGQTDFAVVELFSPQYDPATANLTYEATVLDDWNTAEGTSLQHGKLDTAPTSFGATHILIDGIADCPDATMSCMLNGNAVGTIANADHDGYCYSWGNFACFPCQPWTQDPSYWTDQCNSRFADACGGKCSLWNFCSRDAPLGNTLCEWSDSASHFGG